MKSPTLRLLVVFGGLALGFLVVAGLGNLWEPLWVLFFPWLVAALFVASVAIVGWLETKRLDIFGFFDSIADWVAGEKP